MDNQTPMGTAPDQNSQFNQSQSPAPLFNPAPNTSPQKVNLPALAIPMLYIIVLFLGIFGTYALQNGKITDLQSQINQLKGSVAANIDNAKFQAVFMTTGELTYFGKLSVVDNQNYKLTDVYYVKQIQNNAADKSLVKLGCELQGSTDQMVINRDQVAFWENLKDDGQVTKAIADYKKQNPNGQKCESV